MCLPMRTPHFHSCCGCGCIGFPEVEDEVKMLEDHKKALQNQLEAIDRRISNLKKKK